MILTDVSLKNRVAVGVLVVLIVITGAYSYLNLPPEAAPDVPIPIILITTTYQGVAPEDVETSVTMKIEKELAGLKGVKEIRSSSAEGMSMIVIEFQPDIIIDDAMQYVRDRIDLAKAELPDDADEPSLKEINISDFPIMMISISGDMSPVRLKMMADDMEDAIEQIPGVLNVDVLGALEREIRLEIDRDRLASRNLTIPELLQLIPSENVNISAGGLETEGTRFNVRVPAEFVDPGEVDHLLIAVRDGNPIYLADVAVVHDTFKDRSTYSRLDGRESITVSVQKRAGANIIAISEAVKQIIREAERQAPAGVTFELTEDQSKHVRNMVLDLENNIASGLVLVVGMLMLFVGLRSSIIVSLVIPLSMLISFTIIAALGYTLNMVVLFSLVLALGMLVDNAVVIVENIYRHMQLGKARFRAAVEATREVAWPVVTSTLTTVAAFFPLLFWPDVIGDFMSYLPITLIITLSSSMFVALVVSPVVCSLFGRADKRHRKHIILHAYSRFLRLAVNNWAVTLTLSVLLLIALAGLYVKLGKGIQFLPDSDPDRAIVNIRCPQGTNIRETDRLTRIVEERVETYRPWLKNVITNVGSSGSFFGDGGTGGPHVGNLTLIFKDYEARERPSGDIIQQIREELADIPGAEIKVEKERMGPPTGAAVTVRVIGRDFPVLERLSEQARKMIADVPGLVNLRSDLEATRPELVFRVDRRRAMLLGANTATVGNFLKMAIFGREVGTYRQYNDEYDITVRLPHAERANIENILGLQVPNNAGASVPLSSLGTFDYKGGFGTINRVDQKRVVTLTGDAEGRLAPAVLADVQARLASLEKVSNYEISYAGEKEDQDKAAAFLSKAFMVAVLLITLILVAQFNSLIVPFIIMFTVVLSLIGVLAGLIICGIPFGIIMTGIGVISLAGVVVNNAIVLLDYTRQLQARGMSLIDAAVEAGETRLRPVLLTASTTMLGLVPMATGVSYDFHTWTWATRSQSSEWWNGMAIAVIFGLGFATMLTLVVVPTMYVLMNRIKDLVRKLLGISADAPAAR